MRHPAAPTIIAILLGFLVAMILYHALVSDGHHEGNPHPDDVPKKDEVQRVFREFEDEGEDEDDVKRA
jgi:hypothetical protein